MALDKQTREQMLAHCGQIQEEDGSDARDFFSAQRPGRKPSRKLQQLCRQVAETISLVLSGECADQELHNLQVVSVDPAPDASRLVVRVKPDDSAKAHDLTRTMELLRSNTPRLRGQVAAAITRKRAPTLVFQIVTADSMHGGA